MTRFLCYIGFHRYARRFNDQGEHYLECTRCKKYKDATGSGAGAGASVPPSGRRFDPAASIETDVGDESASGHR
jgi:hypothetical protein